MNKDLLPSRQFVKKVSIIFGIIILIFTIYKIIPILKNKKDKPANLIIKESVLKDSNNNGIADWEEYLWGLDPDANGAKNKEFILAQKAKMSQNSMLNQTDNDTLAKQFFVAIVSLQESGNINSDSLMAVSEAVGKNIEVSPIPDIYTEKDILAEKSTAESIDRYKKNLGVLIKNYEDKNIGDELTFIAKGITDKDPQAFYAAYTVSKYYKAFAEDLIKTPVPNSYITIHLSLANNYAKNGQIIETMSKSFDDEIIAMRSLINYKKYNEALLKDYEYLLEI